MKWLMEPNGREEGSSFEDSPASTRGGKAVTGVLYWGFSEKIQT